MQEHRRVHYMDLAKGLCMLIIVIGHSGVTDIFSITYTLLMPLFFFCSGFFFSEEIEWKRFAVGKVKKLLVPYMFFYLVSYLFFYLGNAVAPGVIKTLATGITDVFTQRQCFNGPIWFLLALFWLLLMFYGLCIAIRKEWIKAIAVCAIGVIGSYIGKKVIFLPCFFDVALTAMPFFYVGYLMKKFSSSFENSTAKKMFNALKKWQFFIVSMCLYGIVVLLDCICSCPYIRYFYNQIYGSYIACVIISLIFVFAFICLCKGIGHIRFISYFGKYSIIPLCTHHLIYRPIAVALSMLGVPYTRFFVAVITVAVCYGCIFVIKNYLPWAVGLNRN